MTRELVSAGAVVGLAALIAMWLSVESRAQSKPSLGGAWTLNKELSDQPPARGEERGDGGHRGGGGGGYGHRGGGGGGYGRGRMGGGGGGGYGGGQPEDRESMERMREALRTIVEPSEHLTITQSESTVVIADAEGRTTRLATNGSKVKEDNTKIERKTHWENDKLVSEISGAGPGKITQTYSVDSDRHQLRVTTNIEGGRNGQAQTLNHVYDADRTGS